MPLEPHKRIPLHNHEDSNSGGAIHAPAIVAAAGGSSTTSGSGAPTSVDYLIGTASDGLSAALVVGTTPGGELGGTWASPTVDTVHSGSSHAAAIQQHILLADGHATPFTFNDLLQMDDGSDFMWSDS